MDKSNQSHFPSNQRLHIRSRALVCNKFCWEKEAENVKNRVIVSEKRNHKI